jgi:3-methylcrotonyl-CoA carboxylase alpha subunit
VDTGLIDRQKETLCAKPAPAARYWAIAAVHAAALLDGPLTGFTLWQPLQRQIALRAGDEEQVVMLTVMNIDACEARIGDASIQLQRRAGGWGVSAVSHGDYVTVFGAQSFTFVRVDLLDRASAGARGDTVLAPMPGLVRDVAVSAGQAVAEGARLIVLEAMKMEHVLRAPRDGVIENVTVVTGDQVTAGSLMVRLEDET